MRWFIIVLIIFIICSSATTTTTTTLLVLVEVQIDWSCVVKYVIVLTVGKRVYVYVCAWMVYVHDVVDYVHLLAISSCLGSVVIRTGSSVLLLIPRRVRCLVSLSVESFTCRWRGLWRVYVRILTIAIVLNVLIRIVIRLVCFHVYYVTLGCQPGRLLPFLSLNLSLSWVDCANTLKLFTMMICRCVCSCCVCASYFTF